ncbi:MAG: hypothetical protein IJC63_00805 [Myxococcaceae bacterium]|nr:hypothetical protein [Myxococcaceae bacterium]
MRGFRILLCALFASSLFLACGDAADGETAAEDKLLEPLAQSFPVDQTQKDAVKLRLAPAFFNNVNTNWKSIVGEALNAAAGTSELIDSAHFNEGGHLVIPVQVPCTSTSFPFEILSYAVTVPLHLCDTNGDGMCAEDGTESCAIDLVAQAIELAPEGTAGTSRGALTAKITAAIKTPDDNGLKITMPLDRLNTTVDGSITADGQTPITVSIGLDVWLGSDPLQLLQFELHEIEEGVYLGGIDSVVDAIDISLGSSILDGAIGLIKGTLISALGGTIQTAIKDALDKASAQPCSFATDDESDMNGTCAAAGQTCECYATGGLDCARADLRCKNADGSFPSIYPGYEGRVVLGKLLSAFGADAASAFDFALAIGGGLDIAGLTEGGSKTGYIHVGAQAGVLAFPDAHATCVPPTMAAPIRVEGSLDDALKTGPSGHQVGVGISEYALNNALYQVTRSGALCLDIGTETVAMLTSTLFAGFVPSLSLLGKDLPMSLAIRPGQAPRISFGKNLIDESGAISDPLATVVIEDLSLDVYASIEERTVRLFTLNVDVAAPVALELGTNELGQTTAKPVIGKISQMLVFNTEVETNSEILTEDISNLGNQLGSLLSMADGLIGGLISELTIPDVMGLRFRVDGLNGMAPDTNGQSAYLGAFVSVVPIENAAQ